GWPATVGLRAPSRNNPRARRPATPPDWFPSLPQNAYGTNKQSSKEHRSPSKEPPCPTSSRLAIRHSLYVSSILLNDSVVRCYEGTEGCVQIRFRWFGW